VLIYDPLHDAVHGPAVVPISDQEDIELGFAPDGVRPVTDGGKARSRPAKPAVSVMVSHACRVRSQALDSSENSILPQSTTHEGTDRSSPLARRCFTRSMIVMIVPSDAWYFRLTRPTTLHFETQRSTGGASSESRSRYSPEPSERLNQTLET